MIKRTICLLLLTTLLFSLFGCNRNNQNDTPNAVNFYYKTSNVVYHDESGFIDAEKRSIQQAELELAAILNLYLNGPESTAFVSPFPQNTVVRNITHKNGIISITLSNEFSMLHSFELSVACACLTLTVQQFVDTNLVQISADGADLDGNRYITMNTDSLVLYDYLKQ